MNTEQIDAMVGPGYNKAFWRDRAAHALYELVKPAGGLEWYDLTPGQRQDYRDAAQDAASDVMSDVVPAHWGKR